MLTLVNSLSFANISAIFWTNLKRPNGVRRGPGDTDSWKSWSQKSSVRLPLIAGDGVRGVHTVAGGPLARHLPPQHPLPHRGGVRQAPLKTPNQTKHLVPNRFCYLTFQIWNKRSRAGIFKQSMGARHRVGIRLSFRPVRLHRLTEFIPWNWCLGSINV